MGIGKKVVTTTKKVVTSAPARRIGKAAWNATKSVKSGNINNIIDAAKISAIRTGGDMLFEHAHRVATSDGSGVLKTAVRGLKTTFGEIPPPIGGDKREHAKVTQIGPTGILALGTEKLQVFRRSVHTGVPSSKTLKELSKENGKTKYTLFNTKNSAPSDSLHATRKMLTFGTGFDQRGYSAFGRVAYFTKNDLKELVLAIPDNAFPTTGADERIYASILNTKTRYTIRNQAAYHRAKLKVHTVSFTPKESANDGTDPVKTLADRVFWYNIDNSPIGSNAADEKVKVPLLMQLGNLDLKEGVANENYAPSYALSVDISPKGSGIKTSPYFRENYEIIDTQSCILGPGDFLEFEHTHHYGSGVDVTALMSNLYNLTNDSLQDRLNYFHIIEYVGTLGEVTYVNPNGETLAGPAFEAHIGTIPVILNSEIQKEVTYVNAGRSGMSAGPTSGKDRCHFRQFSTASMPRIDNARRDFSLPLSDWVVAVSTSTPFKYMTQVTSDRMVRAESHVAGNTNATDIIP